MGRINVLDKHVAELIAAGEVVERPSSVIKELVENSIDSGASSVTVEIQNGGITMMRVTDNGSGIMRDDIRNAFLRHATSKVKVQTDLDAISTLGFRGEALASIAAVARVELLTKSPDEEIGTHYNIEGCDEVLLEDAGCPNGTTFVIRDLFYNVPARMKFLKKNVSEGNAVAAVIEKIALSHSEIAFSFIRDGRQTLVTSGDGNLRNCIYSVLGREFTNASVKVDYALNGVKVSGYVTKPQIAKPTRSLQNFFINGRFVKSRTAMAALEEACKGMVMVGKFPGCVLHIELSYEAVDVNVHPSKIEVRFVNEKPIFEAVYYGVKSALTKGDTAKEFQIESAKLTENLIDKSVVQKPFTMSQHTVESIKKQPIIRPSQREFIDRRAVKNYNSMLGDIANDSQGLERYSEGKTAIFEGIKINDNDTAVQESFIKTISIPPIPNCRTENNTKQAHTDDSIKVPETVCITATSEQKIPEDTESASENINIAVPDDNIRPIIKTDGDRIRYIGEAFKTYIIIERNDELVIIDKHALHERIIYEKLKREQGKKYAQYLLEPAAVKLTREQSMALIENKYTMNEAGFEIDDFGSDTVLVRSAPSFIDAFDVAATVEEMAEHILSNNKEIESEYTDWLYHNIACRSAIKGGDTSSPEELMRLYNMMEEDPSYRYCPHGRPTSMVVSKYKIEKQFGRV